MKDIDTFRVAPGTKLRLSDHDPGSTGEYAHKRDAQKVVRRNLARLAELQERLYAGQEKALLIVLQAMDTGGKDGTIGHVMGAFNPQGVHVTCFKAPTEEELAHDFLWRVHRVTPRRGMVAIFNRSHYEDVLVVRVKGLRPKGVWSARYEHINRFERLLADAGVTIVKLFLHISPAEQAERLRDRQQRADKHWKFNPSDLEDRALWPRYMEAYRDALSRCSTPWAPWHVVPADHKWYRNLVVSRILVETMEAMDLRYPPPPPDIASYAIPEV